MVKTHFNGEYFTGCFERLIEPIEKQRSPRRKIRRGDRFFLIPFHKKGISVSKKFLFFIFRLTKNKVSFIIEMSDSKAVGSWFPAGIPYGGK